VFDKVIDALHLFRLRFSKKDRLSFLERFSALKDTAVFTIPSPHPIDL